MKILTVITAFLIQAPAAHAFIEELVGSEPLSPYPEHHLECRYSFGWGRNTVSVKYLDEEGTPLECNFTHSERSSKSANSSSLIDALFYQHYSCTDGSRAAYVTNWLGSTFSFTHYPAGADFKVSCK